MDNRTDLYDAIRKATEIALRQHWELIRRFEFFGTNEGKHPTHREWVEMGYEISTDELGPICPFCREVNTSQGDDCWAEKRGEGLTDCSECGKQFCFAVDYTTTYCSRKPG